MDVDRDELSEDDKEEGADLEHIVRQLDKSSPVKKRGQTSKDKEATNRSYSQVAAMGMGSLRMSGFIPHKFSNPRVIIEGSVRLTNEDKVAQFIGFIGVLLTEK